jgi:hypothetical protein
MEPIVAADGREVALECLGCAISKKEVEPPGGMIAETDYFTLANDFEYPIKGFLISRRASDRNHSSCHARS